MKKLGLAVLCLTVLLVLHCFTAGAFAEISGSCGDNVTYVLDADGVLTISGTGAMKNFSDYGPWYSARDSIKTVIISNGVTSIGRCAFKGCREMTSVTIPGGVTSIGDYAFNKCSSLTSVTLPGSLDSIGYDAMSGRITSARPNNILIVPISRPPAAARKKRTPFRGPLKIYLKPMDGGSF